jgi:hypothetical protein
MELISKVQNSESMFDRARKTGGGEPRNCELSKHATCIEGIKVLQAPHPSLSSLPTD